MSAAKEQSTLAAGNVAGTMTLTSVHYLLFIVGRY